MIFKNLFIRVCVFLFSLTILLSFNDQTLINQLTDFNKQTIKYTDHGLSQFYIPKGLLNISEMNGNVIYSYPISKSNINGSDINVTLNYNGSVQHTAYLRCIVDNANLQDDWVRVKQNRPLWIMGVNGFAVQAFTEKNLFFCNPIWMEKLNDSANVFDDKFVWTVDGYDVCNSMNSIYKNKDGQDEIKLLKADGSLLVLKNSYIFKYENENPCIKDFYSGYYYTEEPNSKIWAFVDFKSNPDRNSYYELLEKDSLKLSINNGYYDSCEVMSYNYRRVYLFNDDGLVYVFREDKVPYGSYTYTALSENFFDSAALPKYSIGRTEYERGYNQYNDIVKAVYISSPSIFYLESIYNQNQKSLEFKYEDFFGVSINQYNIGRMKLKEFNGHNINYIIDGNTGFSKDIVINSLGRDIALMMTIVKKDGYGAIDSTQRQRKISDDREIMLSTIKNHEMYSSRTNYITQIFDNGLVYNFNYEQYTKNIVQNNIFCVETTKATPNYFWNNYRLTLIKEPISEYELAYKPDLLYSGKDDANYRFALNNHINKVTTKGVLSDSLKTEAYSYAIGNGSLGNGMFQTCKTIIDHKNGDLQRSIHSTFLDETVNFDCFHFVNYRSINHVYLSSVIDSVANSPHYFKTEYYKKRINDSSFYFADSVIKTYEVFNGKQFLTSYKYKNYNYTNGILNFKKPVKDSSAYNNYWVDFENRMGLKLVSDTTIDYYPNDLTKIIQNEINTYSNFKEEIFMDSSNILTWNKIATQQQFLRDRISNPDLVWEDYMCENGVYDSITTEKYRFFIPPIYELHTSSKLIDSNNILIKRIEKNINNTNYENGMLTLTRGLILNDTSYGKGGLLSFVNSYQYFGLEDNVFNRYSKSNRMPKETINPNGLKLNFYYELNRMDDLNLNTKCGDDKVIYCYLLYSNNPVIDSIEISNFYYEQYHSKPIYENIEVRKIGANGAITSKSLATKYSRDMYGNPLIISDQNDWASLLKYDNLNRLTLLNMPGDIWDRKTLIRINTPQVVQPFVESSNFVADFWFHCAMINNNPSSSHDTVYHSILNDNDFKIGFNSILSNDDVLCRCWGEIPQRINSDKDNTYQENQYPASKQVYKQPTEKLQSINTYNYYDTFNTPYPATNNCYDSTLYHRNQNNSIQLNLEKPQYCDEIFSLDSIKISLSITQINNIQTIVDVEFLSSDNYGQYHNIKTLHVSIEPNTLTSSTISNFDIVITPGSDSLSQYQFSSLISNINENRCYVKYSTATEGSMIKIHNDLSFNNIATFFDSVQYANPDEEYLSYITFPITVMHKPLVYYYGSFDMKYSDKDYTVKQRFGKNFIDVFEKIDDSYNSSNEGLNNDPLNPYFFRDKLTRTIYDHFNKQLSIIRSKNINNSEQYQRYSQSWIYRNGYGNVYHTQDPFNYDKEVIFDGYGNTLKTIDEIGAEVNYEYRIDEPALLGINPADQDFFGYCKLKTEKKYLINIAGASIINAEYYDVFGRLRKKVQDTLFLKLTTKYNYNDIGELIEVINPKNDTVRYWYDEFGKVHYKYHPDLGYTSYRYDKLGNTRFSQNQTQADSNRVSYFEYDDLNRLSVVGEAKIGGLAHLISEPYYNYILHNYEFNRISDILDPLKTNNGYDDLVTLNRTLWQSVDNYSPTYYYNYAYNEYISFNPIFTDSTNKQLSVKYFTPDGQKFFHPVAKQDSVHYITISASIDSFENISKYPLFVRQVYHYDELPERIGAVWNHLQSQSDIDKLTPKGKVRNLKGRLSAVAYRDKGDETFNYMVYSYDERGRVEAQVRYTENIGFDAIHYYYNSQNTITKKVVIDPYKTLATWYGYDKLGRIDSVWNELYPINYFSIPNQINSVYTSFRPPSELYDFVYSYDKMDRIDTITYKTGFVTKKQINLYSPRSELIYTGLPENQYFNVYSYSLSGLLELKTVGYPFYDTLLNNFVYKSSVLNYSYDFTDRLIGYNSSLNGMHSFGNYYYDAAGNRDSSRSIVTLNPQHPDYKYNRINQNTYSSTYKNRLIAEVQNNNNNVPEKYQFFDYFGNGNLHQRRIKEIDSTFIGHGGYNIWNQQIEKFGYNFNNLTINYQKQFKKYVTLEDTVFINGINFEEWRYKYNPFGERESKMRWQKSYYSGSISPVNAWVYYSLGTSNEQNAVYQGFETSQSMILGRSPLERYQNYSQASVLFMYPVEYNVFANGRNHVMTYKYDPLGGGWRKYYNIYDELGSVALVINDSGRVVESNQYKAFGLKDYSYKERPQATGYIGKEKDTESNLADHGVRKYDSDLDRFLCPDAMWEKYISYTPYQYAGNDPINKVDWDGRDIKYEPHYAQSNLEKSLNTSLNYLLSGGPESNKLANRIINLINDENNVLFIQAINPETDGLRTSTFFPNQNKPTIAWDPNSALKTDDGQKMSPASRLFEEFIHYFNWVDNPQKFTDDTSKSDPTFNKIEERNAKCNLNEIMKELGEGEHNSHDGENYKVESPIKK